MKKQVNKEITFDDFLMQKISRNTYKPYKQANLKLFEQHLNSQRIGK